MVDSIATLLEDCDLVMLETNDGTEHLAQALEVFRAGKPVFIDKPIAASLTDVLTIYRAAHQYKVPCFLPAPFGILKVCRKCEMERSGK